jgi:MFS family permease
VLASAQVLDGVGISAAVAAGSLLVVQITGTDAFAGLAQTTGVLGAAAAAVPLARISNQRGRRPGLATGIAAGAVGAVTVIVAGVQGWVWLLLIGTFVTGMASAAGYQARYAATDLADDDRVGLSLSLVVWASTIGVVAGPNLMAPAAGLAASIGLPRLTGPYLLTGAALATAAVVIAVGLRPDPLLTARRRRGEQESPPHVSLREGLAVAARFPAAVVGLASIALGHVVMVMVMVMTPVHMQEMDVTLSVIGVVISVHVLGMYAFSPLVGWLTDRWSARGVVLTGVVVLLAAVVVAGTAADMAVTQLGVGLFLLGLGWSCTLVAGSAMVTEAVPDAQRPGVQGAGDTLMNLAAALGGVVAGVVVWLASYHVLNLVAALLLVPLAVLAGRLRPPRSSNPPRLTELE